jgi:hypothetical protein
MDSQSTLSDDFMASWYVRRVDVSRQQMAERFGHVGGLNNSVTPSMDCLNHSRRIPSVLPAIPRFGR